jgi:hypothetical protein
MGPLLTAWGPHGVPRGLRESGPLEEKWPSRPLVSGKRLRLSLAWLLRSRLRTSPVAGHGPGSAKAGPGQTEAFEQRNPLPP